MLIQKDITTVEKGVIMHQVNCQNVMGAGVAKAIYLKHPLVKQAFHDLAKKSHTILLTRDLDWFNQLESMSNSLF